MKNKRRDLKILWNSNSIHANSGYSVESRDILFRLKKDGWDIATIGFYGVEGYHVFLDGGDLIDERFSGTKLKVYPKMGDPWGNDAVLAHAQDYRANVVFAMQDIWALDPNMLNVLGQSNIKFCPYLPIDQEPVQKGVLANCNFAYKIFTFSKFGQKALEDEGYTSQMIYEGIDLEIFKPMDKAKVRQKFNLPQDAFIFGMIGANKENPPRKGYQEALEAFKLFLENHPEGAMFFHNQQVQPGNFPILDYAKYLGIEKKIFYLDQYRSTFSSDSKTIVEEINCFDVQLHPSQTEGFGLLIIEAQAAGVPVIVNRCHSQPELVIEGKTGEICETSKPHWRSSNGFTYPADVKSLHEKMELTYDKIKKDKNKISVDCRNFVKENFDIDKIVKERWIPALEDLQEELLPKVDTEVKSK